VLGTYSGLEHSKPYDVLCCLRNGCYCADCIRHTILYTQGGLSVLAHVLHPECENCVVVYFRRTCIIIKYMRYSTGRAREFLLLTCTLHLEGILFC
jgi:hypothetical protein